MNFRNVAYKHTCAKSHPCSASVSVMMGTRGDVLTDGPDVRGHVRSFLDLLQSVALYHRTDFSPSGRTSCMHDLLRSSPHVCG